MGKRIAWVWRQPAVRKRIALITLTVGGLVSAGHALLDAPRTWLVLHAAFPAIVFTSGCIAGGNCRFTSSVVLKGALTVLTVATAFTAIYFFGGIPPLPRTLLTFAVPLIVSTLGAATGPQPSA